MNKNIPLSGGFGNKKPFARTRFDSLDDTFQYIGQAGKVVTVRGDETGLTAQAEAIIDDHKVSTSGSDTSPGYLVAKLEAGIAAAISETGTNPNKKAKIDVSLGTGAHTACAGNDSRLSDARTPTAHAFAGPEHLTSQIAAIQSKVGDGSLITTAAQELYNMESAIPVSGDLILIEDSSDGYKKKSANLGLIPVQSHDFAGSIHNASLLSEVNAKISDANVISDGANEFNLIIPPKASPVGADKIIIEDSADGWKKKSAALSTVPAGAPSGTAGGDLSGTYPNPVVAKASKSFLLPGIISDTVTSQKDDYNPTGLSDASTIFITTEGGDQHITGLVGGVPGRIIIIKNVSTGSKHILSLLNNSGSSSAANRFDNPNGISVDLGDDHCVILQYSGITSRWNVIASFQQPYGTASNTICEGNDSRLTNSRSPSGAASGDLAGTYPGPTVSKSSTAFALDAAITPAALSGDTNNWNPTGLSGANVIRASASAAYNLTGLAGGSSGRLLLLENVGSFNITVLSENANSTAANRFLLTADLILTPNKSVICKYDFTASRWRIIPRPSDPYGTALNTVCQGNDSRLSDSRTPSGSASGDLAGTYPSPTVSKSSTAFSLTGSITPTIIGGNQNDYNPTGLSGASKLRLSTSANYALTGLAGGSAGRIIIIHNVGSFNLTLNNEDGGSSAANRFSLLASTNHTLQPRECLILQYDSTESRWHSIGEVMDPYGTAANTICQGNDSRLSDARTPTAHALGGTAHSSDTITNLNTKLSDGSLITSKSGEINSLTAKTSPTTSDLIMIEDTAASNAKKKSTIAQVLAAGAVSSFPEFQFYADQLRTPVSSEWPRYGSAAATLAQDSVNGAMLNRQFDDTADEGVALDIFIPSGATNIIFDFYSRAQTAPGTAKQVLPGIYVRQVADNAAAGSFSSLTALTAIDIPITNAYFQYDTQTIALSTLSLTAGRLTQILLERTATSATDNLVGDWNLNLLRIRFS